MSFCDHQCILCVCYVMYAVCYVCVKCCIIGDATSRGGIYKLETEMCLFVWILTICSSVVCVWRLVGMFVGVDSDHL